MTFQRSLCVGNLMDQKAVEGILKEAEAVVHMGAIPGPLRAEPRFIFENNVAADFNVMMSAAELGLRRVVFSSSAFGMGWAHDGNAFVPLYLPLEEEHPMIRDSPDQTNFPGYSSFWDTVKYNPAFQGHQMRPDSLKFPVFI